MKKSVYGLFAGAEADLFVAPKGGSGNEAKISATVPDGYVKPHDDDDCDDCLVE